MKCEFICALLHKPNIVFLDEPTVGLDVVVQEKIRNFILHYKNKYHATIVMTSHYMEDIEKLCDRVIFIEQGKKYFDGTLNEFIKNYGNEIRIHIELNKKIKHNWECYGKVISTADHKIRIVVPEKEVARVKSKICLIEGVQSVQTDHVDAAEIVRNHFEMRTHA